MKHLISAILVFGLACSGAGLAPAYAEAPQARSSLAKQAGGKEEAAVSVIGAWTGSVSGYDGVYIWEFLADGSWRAGEVGAESYPDAGRWSQVDAHVVWLYPNGTVYYGRLSSANALSGRANWADGSLVGDIALTRSTR